MSDRDQQGPNSQEPKIVVDEDWKEQVQREKEAAEAATQATGPQPQGAGSSAGAEAAAGPLPPASFGSLVGSLAAQAMAALGQVPDPIEGHPVVRPDVARHVIDTLGVLQEKPRGNLTPEAANTLDALLHDLRMLFLAVCNAPAPDAPAENTT